MPYQFYIDKGLFEIEVHNDGRKEPRVTSPKGIMFLWLKTAEWAGKIDSPLEELKAAKEAGVNIYDLEDFFNK